MSVKQYLHLLLVQSALNLPELVVLLKNLLSISPSIDSNDRGSIVAVPRAIIRIPSFSFQMTFILPGRRNLFPLELFRFYNQKQHFHGKVGYSAAREPLFPLFPALTWFALGIKKREEDEKGQSNGGLGAQASASKRTDEIQTRDNFLTLLLADRSANRFPLPPFPRCSLSPFVDWQFRVLNFYPARRNRGCEAGNPFVFKLSARLIKVSFFTSNLQ